MNKTSVRVNLDWDEKGKYYPRRIYWRDGRVFDVHLISTSSEDDRMCYTVRLTCGGLNVLHNITYLFFERENGWSVPNAVPFI